jgi:hypothetical protein
MAEVVYLEGEGWPNWSKQAGLNPHGGVLGRRQSGFPRWCTWSYPDGGIPGASRLVLILKVVYLEE